MTQQKHRLALIATGAIASLMVGFTLTPTFAAIVASIQNTTNTASTGTLTMKESSGSANCNSFDSNTTNTASCATINKYGGTTKALTPGGAATVTNITIQNTGNITANGFTLNPGTCTASNVQGASHSGNGDLCDKIQVKIESGNTVIFNGTAKNFQAGGQIDLLNKLSKAGINASESVPFKFSVSLDSSADASHQGRQISQPMTWTFNG